jgi:hypothetical protein
VWRPCMNPLPCPDQPRNDQLFPWTRGQRPIGWATLSSCQGVSISEYCTREPANRRPRLMGRYRAIVPVPGDTISLGGPPTGACGWTTVWALWHAVHRTRPRGSKTKHLMARGGGSRANAVVKTHQRALPCVLTGIIDAAASSEQRCHAGPPPSIRGC